MWRAYPFQEGDVQAHRSTLNFVDSVWEVFGPLLAGIPIAIISIKDGTDTERLLETCRNAGVTRITVVPSQLRTMLVASPDLAQRVPSMRLWISSGERLTRPLYDQFRMAAPNALLLNLYGSTEVAGDVTCAALGPDAIINGDIPIGRPISNARIFILDADKNPVQTGEVGGLYIGGPVLARGYHQRPDEDAVRFLVDPNCPGERIFWTGDLVRANTEGDLFYIGRADNQIKLRGMRIEPEEVEYGLSTYQHVVSAAAVVLQRRADSEEGRLIAFVAPASLDVHDLRKHLVDRLPSHMVPTRIIAVNELPLTPNGKIDRPLLSRMNAWRSDIVPEHQLPQTTTEKIIANIWARSLETWPISRDENFFDLGGDSLSVVTVAAEIRNRF
jgi:acyl-coenzyme A synthetase/AMP-(fatty) acid ligase